MSFIRRFFVKHSSISRKLTNFFESGLFLGMIAFLGALLLIVILTWPWVLHFDGEFLEHWDPPFHAWKLELMARRILAGDLFMASVNTNMLYPNNGTLYYEALQWPPALFAAILFRITHWSAEFIYHVTLIVFWALSAPCMMALLRELKCSKAAAVTGGILFCILPERISYMVEFQMQLLFAMPLFFMYVIRFYENLRIRDAAAVSFCWWILAVSELYQAVFAAITVVPVVLALTAKNWGVLRNKRFWKGAIVAVALGICLLFVLLIPYMWQRTEGAVLRQISEVKLHSAQPFSYLRPFGRFAPWKLKAKIDELSLYPTLTILFLFFLTFVKWIINMRNNLTKGKWYLSVIPGALVAFFGLFVSIAFLFQFRIISSSWAIRHIWGSILPVICLTLSLCYCFLGDLHRSFRSVFLTGLLSASILAYFFSMGPYLTLEIKGFIPVKNILYCSAYNKWMPFLSGFRVVSRFGVIVLFSCVCIATVGLDRILRLSLFQRSKMLTVLVCLITVSAMSIECVPKKIKFTKIDECYQRTPVLKRLENFDAPFSLAFMPTGPRKIEGPRMFSLLKDEWLYMYAWGGFFPENSIRLRDSIGYLRMDEAYAQLIEIWPTPLLVVDKQYEFRVTEDVEQMFPDLVHIVNGESTIDIRSVALKIGDEVDSDDRYSIIQLKPEKPSNLIVRRFRSDIAKRNPVFRCRIKAPAGEKIIARFNSEVVGESVTGEDGVAVFNGDLSNIRLQRSLPNSLTFEPSSQDKYISMDDFYLSDHAGCYTGWK